MSDITKRFFGYDCKIVDDTIERLNKELEDQKAKVKELEEKMVATQEKNTQLEMKIGEYEKVHEAVKQSLVSAKKVSDSMIASATKQCDQKLNQTEKQAQKIIADQNEKLDLIRKDYGLWVKRYNDSINRYRSLLEAQLNLIGEEKFKIDNYGLPDVSKIENE